MKISLQQAYSTLGVAHGASEEEARSAYRKLALQFHPDKNPQADATARFQEISAAYKRIGDFHKRQKSGGNQRGFFGADDYDDDDGEFDFDDADIDLDDLELSFEEMLMMFEMMFGGVGIEGKKSKSNGKKKATTSGATRPAVTKEGIKVPVKSRRRKAPTTAKTRGRMGDMPFDLDDDLAEAAFASFLDPELMLFEQFMGMAMDDPEMKGKDGEMMKEMMHMFADDDMFGFPSMGKKSKKKSKAKRSGINSNETSHQAVDDVEEVDEIEEVSDWDDADSHAEGNHDIENQPNDAVTEAKPLEVGARVQVYGKLNGTVMYTGSVHYSKGDFVGVQLDEPQGKNNGTIKGVAYFKCDPRHGLMVRPQDVTFTATAVASVQQ